MHASSGIGLYVKPSHIVVILTWFSVVAELEWYHNYVILKLRAYTLLFSLNSKGNDYQINTVTIRLL